MDLLYHNSIRKYVDMSKSGIQCPACLEDDTVPQERKASPLLSLSTVKLLILIKSQDALYYKESKLHSHMESYYHSPFNTFCRKAEAVKDDKGHFICPYCTELGQDSQFETQELLLAHVRSETLFTQSSEMRVQHKELVQAAGWCDPGFKNENLGTERKRKAKTSDDRRHQEILHGQRSVRYHAYSMGANWREHAARERRCWRLF